MRLVVFSCVSCVELRNLQYSDMMPAALSLRRRSIYEGILLVINMSLLRGKLLEPAANPFGANSVGLDKDQFIPIFRAVFSSFLFKKDR
jgi:hypothetical protein